LPSGPVAKWLRICAPIAGGLGYTPDQGTRPHTPQVIVHMPQLKILYTRTKTFLILELKNSQGARKIKDPGFQR